MTLSRFWSRHADQTFVRPKPAATTLFTARGRMLDAIGKLVNCRRSFPNALVDSFTMEFDSENESDEVYRRRIAEVITHEMNNGWLTLEDLLVRATICGIALDKDDVAEDRAGVELCIGTSCEGFLGTGQTPEPDEAYDEAALTMLFEEQRELERSFEDFDFEPADEVETMSHEIVEMDVEELADDSINQPACRHCGQPYIDCTCEEFVP